MVLSCGMLAPAGREVKGFPSMTLRNTSSSTFLTSESLIRLTFGADPGAGCALAGEAAG
jgi:hypothetical protein